MRFVRPTRVSGLRAAILAAFACSLTASDAFAQMIVQRGGMSYLVSAGKTHARDYRISSRLLDRVAPGMRVYIGGTRSYDRRSYRFRDTFPSSYIRWTPYGLQYDFDQIDRLRAGYPYGLPRWGHYPGTYQDGVIIGQEQRLTESDIARLEGIAVQDVAPPEPTTIELAVDALGAGEYASAIAALDEFGTREGDGGGPWPDDRWRAVALAGLGEIDRAAEAMLGAYLIDPQLAAFPLDGNGLAPTNRALRAIVTDAVNRAHKADTDAHWLLVASLMLSEGREGPALKMVARARDRGLDPSITEAFEAAFGTLPESSGR